ncbi:SMI1/KNR4 family protein [Actinocorallia populi]|uniref:hypothetical protein n=1 Tax=Actinocorallia populi TaxID=2079200 RepID=UPI000D0928C0|nr:hypothetical protein [Actinocorallia populi]
MTDGFDLGRALTEGLDDRIGAWRFIRGFAQHWVTPLGEDDGWSEADLSAAEERLGLPLPTALREAYRLFGRRKDLSSNHDVLLSPAELYLDDRKEALVFRHENQGAASWGVLVTELGEPDPAVFVKEDLADKQAETWESWLGKLSLAFIEIVLSESLNGPEELTDFLNDLDEEGAGALEEHYALLPFPEYPISGKSLGIRWFAGPDSLLREDGRMALLARARTGEALGRIRDRISGDWLNDC